MKKGVFYGVGVGPGDPELMTCKAVRIIRETGILAVPGDKAEESVAYKIAIQMVPEISKKVVLSLPMPMTKDAAALQAAHRQAADQVEAYLEKGEDVVFLTLGDPTIYSTFTYLQILAEEDGYTTGLVSGIPSFCAAAARLNRPIATWQEQIHIIPATHKTELPEEEGIYVLMKSGKQMEKVKQMLRERDMDAVMVERCGMEGEQVYRSLKEIPDSAGYYSLIFANKTKK